HRWWLVRQHRFFAFVDVPHRNAGYKTIWSVDRVEIRKPVQMTLIGRADPHPSDGEDLCARNQIDRAVPEQTRRARTDVMSCADFDDELQILVHRKIEADAGADFIRKIERAFASAKPLDHSATGA